MADAKNFVEIGNAVTDGYSMFHRITYQHPEEECIGWQRGIDNFCEWLDEEGYFVVKVPPNNASSGLPVGSGWRVSLGKFLIQLGELVASFGSR